MNLTLCYHHVSPWRRLHATPPEVFDAHMGSLRRAGYAFLGADEFLAHMREAKRSRARTVLVSFDDGHADNWFHAAPVLAAHGAPALMFVISADVDDGEPRSAGDPGLPVGGSEDDPVRVRWSELAAWAGTGRLSVQSHTHGHRNWRAFGANQRVRDTELSQDLGEAIRVIGSRIGRRPVALAWPWGYCDRAMCAIARDAGFSLQFSVVPGLDRPGVGSERPLHRVVADGLAPDAFERMLESYRSESGARIRSAAHWALSDAREHARRLSAGLRMR